MHVYLCLITAMQVVLAGSAHADLTKPSCEQMWNGYSVMTNGPIWLHDSSLIDAIKAIADNKLMARDAALSEYATADDIANHLRTLKQIDVLMWIGRQYGVLELELQRQKCPQYKHIRIQLMLPRAP